MNYWMIPIAVLGVIAFVVFLARGFLQLALGVCTCGDCDDED